jgi:hypothetical protein
MEVFEMDLCKKKEGFSYYDRCGQYYERIKRVEIGNLTHNLE